MTGTTSEAGGKAFRFACRCEKAWLELVANGEEREAVAWGLVVDALFDNDPRGAISRARMYSLPEKTILAIRDAFDLTD